MILLKHTLPWWWDNKVKAAGVCVYPSYQLTDWACCPLIEHMLYSSSHSKVSKQVMSPMVLRSANRLVCWVRACTTKYSTVPFNPQALWILWVTKEQLGLFALNPYQVRTRLSQHFSWHALGVTLRARRGKLLNWDIRILVNIFYHFQSNIFQKCQN